MTRYSAFATWNEQSTTTNGSGSRPTTTTRPTHSHAGATSSSIWHATSIPKHTRRLSFTSTLTMPTNSLMDGAKLVWQSSTLRTRTMANARVDMSIPTATSSDSVDHHTDGANDLHAEQHSTTRCAFSRSSESDGGGRGPL